MSVLPALLVAALVTVMPTAQASQLTEVDPDVAVRAPGNGASFNVSLSSNGRYVAFHSNASDLVAGDSNGVGDVFVRDLRRRSTELVSVSTGGAPGDGYSASPAISADGRYVAFASVASNLVSGDTNGVMDIFVRDLVRRTTSRVSIGTAKAPANGASYVPAISADGRYVAFSSHASNLVSGDTNGTGDVFVRDLRYGGMTERVSVTSAEAQANGDSAGLQPSLSISADGRYVAFVSNASNLVAGDTNRGPDVFVRDRKHGVTERVNVNSAGAQAAGGGPTGAPSISADGRHLIFSSFAANLVPYDNNGAPDVFVRDRLRERTRRVSVNSAGGPGNNTSWVGTMQSTDANGRYVVFMSAATNLVDADTNDQFDLFLRDLRRGTTQRISVSSSGAQADDYSTDQVISPDGRWIAFASLATTLVEGDTNGTWDVFLRDQKTGTTTLISAARAGSAGH